MNKEIYQYETTMSDEYSEELLLRMAELMKIDYDLEACERAADCMNCLDLDCVCIFRDENNSNRFVMLDTHAPNYVHTFIVRCTNEEHKIIKRTLISIANEMREEEGVKPINNLENTFDISDNAYNNTLKRLNLNLDNYKGDIENLKDLILRKTNGDLKKLKELLVVKDGEITR